MLRAAGASDKGLFRPVNQDRFAIVDDLRLMVVADGVGGHNAGDLAASIAVDAIVEFIRRPESLGWPFGLDPALSCRGNLMRSAIYLAHMRVLEAAQECDAYAGMGTTIVAALVAGPEVVVGHVGDSRVYRWSGRRLHRLTVDDVCLSALTNVVGVRARTDVHVLEDVLVDGDVLLLTTDGVHAVLGDRPMERLMRGGGSPADAADAIVRAAIASGSRDNCTAVVARYEEEGTAVRPSPSN